MTTQQAIDFFGGVRALAKILDTSTQAIHAWGARPPMGRQYEIEVRTKGKLKADREAANG